MDNLNDTVSQAAEKAAAKISDWLKPFGLSVEYTTETLREGQVGEYELDSVFTKIISLKIDADNLVGFCLKEQPSTDMDKFVATQAELTIYHEVGHALVNQITDWYENIQEIHDYVENILINNYFNVFDDQFLSEEDLVEDFAYHFLNERPDQLKEAFEKLDKFITNL